MSAIGINTEIGVISSLTEGLLGVVTLMLPARSYREVPVRRPRLSAPAKLGVHEHDRPHSIGTMRLGLSPLR